LTSIKIFSELLQRRLALRDAKADEYVRIIDGESDRLNRMVTNILDTARIERGGREYVLKEADLCALVRQVLGTMKYLLKKHRFRVKLQLPKGKQLIHADVEAVAQAIINLVSNAIKYSTREKIISVAVLKRNGFVLCRVSDHGDGISKEALPHLFKKFYRAPSHAGAVQGVGLGLSLVQHIMNEHGGRVEVRSVPGKGSSFTLFFPISRIQKENRQGAKNAKRFGKIERK
jgi:two-component system phosphate regulon sensor histidine kinase PhoR